MRSMLLLLGLIVVAAIRFDLVGRPTPDQMTTRQTDRPDTAQAYFMDAHLNQVMVVHAAVVRGDLAAVEPAARALAGLDDGRFPSGAPDQVAAMKAAAQRSAEARDVLEAARWTAEMVIACGNCHRAVGTRPAVPPSAPPRVGGVVGHMLEHQLAADQLLEGLVVPSDALWRAGARALMVAPLNPRELPVNSEVRRRLAPTEERVHRLATDAIQANDPQARAGFYGQVLAGCADCHQLHAKLWGPKPPGASARRP